MLFWHLPLRKQNSNHVPCSLELCTQDQICFSPPKFIGIYKETHPVWYLEGQWSERELFSKLLFLEMLKLLYDF